MRFEIAEKVPYRDFDLPVVHLPEYIEGHYVPDQPFESGDEARKAKLPWNLLTAAQQMIGTRIAANTLRLIEEPVSMEFSARLLGASALNTAWYCCAKGATDVQRRRLKLPDFTSSNPDWRPSSAEIMRDVVTGLEEAEWPAFAVVEAFRYGKARTVEFNPRYGRHVGNVALALAAWDLGDKVKGNQAVSNYLAQDIARERAKDLLRDSQMLYRDIKSFPWFAQLANPNSDLSAFLRNNGPDQSIEAFNTSLDEGLAYARQQKQLAVATEMVTA